MSSIVVSNVSPAVGMATIQEFFSFCGAIDSIKEVASPKLKAFQIDFVSEKALETALLLNEAELENVPMKVEENKLPSYPEVHAGQSEVGTNNGLHSALGDHKVQHSRSIDNEKDSSNHGKVKGLDGVGEVKEGEGGYSQDSTNIGSDAKITGDSQYDDISQEEKPKSAILAQLLASGYKVSDDLINKAISVDRKKGYSNKFVSFLADLDSKYLHSQDPESSTARNISKAQTQLSSLTSHVTWSPYSNKLHKYFEKSMNTPYGVKVHDFYRSVSKEVVDVHNEAKRLLELKKAEAARTPHLKAD